MNAPPDGATQHQADRWIEGPPPPAPAPTRYYEDDFDPIAEVEREEIDDAYGDAMTGEESE